MLRTISFLLAVIAYCNCGFINDYTLKQVVVLSRHNIRTPLSESLTSVTNKPWPKWTQKTSHLTKKGYTMEGNMGEYFAAWLKEEGLLPNSCPDEDTVYFYANTRQRTKQTAIAFAESAFKNCNVTVHYKHNDETVSDPIYSDVMNNNTERFKSQITNEMRKRFGELNLHNAFKELEKILDFKNSPICRYEKFCSLVNGRTNFVLGPGKYTTINGPLEIGHNVVDSFMMSFYNGMATQDIAWGELRNSKQWKLLTQLIIDHKALKFNIPAAAKDYARPLIRYMSNYFKSTNETHKFVFLCGHDDNINNVLTALDFQSYDLPGQYEKFPIGGKVLFEKWTDVNGRDYLKVEYVYQTWNDIREAVKPTLENPPQRVTLKINGCAIDANGMCPWDNFVRILMDYLDS